MTTPRHTAAKEVFLAACELFGDERLRFLAEACRGDDDLRREVDSLLAYHDQATEPVAATPAARPTSRSNGGRFQAGDVFAGRYRIVDELGRGGMGQVYRAHDLVLDQPVALKFLPQQGSDQHLEYLLNEVRLARRVTHPNVCRMFDFGEAEGEIYLTMEYVDGEDLSSLLRRIGRLPEDKLTDLAHDLCAALDAAHREGVLHRDLKPANVLVDSRGRARITDFGIATSTREPKEGARRAAGTPAYMAPEQWAGGEATVRSDLYALGLVLYEMACGEPAFRAKTPAAYAELHRSTQAPLTNRLTELDPELQAVIQRCLEKDPEKRPASAREVAAALPGDRLERALAAGQTPSPQLVAQAGRAGALPVPQAAGLLAALGLVLAAVLLLGDRAFPSRRPWADKSPEVLAARAQEILRSLGHELEAGDRAWGFRPDFENPDGQFFWYRQSPDWMLPSELGLLVDELRVSYYDPPPIDAGMVQMLLDADGRLVTLKVRQAGFDGRRLEEEGDGDEDGNEESGGEPPPSPGTSAEAAALYAVLEAAGLGPSGLERDATRLLPPVWATSHHAWQVADPKDPDRRYHLEVATFEDRVVFFDRSPAADELPPEPFLELWDWYLVAGALFSLALTVAVVLVARANLASGRGDLRGARRLAAAVAVLNLLRFVFAADHVPLIDVEIILFLTALGRILVECLAVWLAYVALEPLVRRRRPHSLIAWSRLLDGRVSDPLVGKSLLVGGLTGAFWVLATELDRLAAGWLGLEAAREIFVDLQLETALTGRRLLAHFLTSGVDAVYYGLVGLFFLVVLELALRHRAAAVGVFVLVSGTLEVMEGLHPGISWLTLGVGIAAVSAVVLLRFGLLAYAAALFSYYVLLVVPLTPSLDAWYAETGLWSLAAIAALGLAGVWTARAGRPFTAAWLEGD